MASSKKSASSELLRDLNSRLAHYCSAGKRIVVGLSGGVDSVVLLDMLDRLRPQFGFNLAAVHVNHQISRSAPEWEGFCVRLCATRKIPIEVKRVQVPRASKQGLEAAARSARYRAFSEIDADCLVLAHHQDDQAETILFNLLRGTGVRGAAGMPGVRERPPQEGMRRAVYARPFLDVTRAALLAYARENGLLWIEDDSNENTAFARNFLRREVTPLIEKRFPGYRQALTRASRHFSEAALLLDDLAEIDLQTIQQDDKLRADPLAALSPARAKNALRAYFVRQRAPMPEADKLEEVLRQLVTARGDRVVKLELGDLVLRRYRGEIWIERDVPAVAPNWALPWHGERELAVAELGGVLLFQPVVGSGVSAAKLKPGNVTIRARHGGEKLRVHPARPRQAVKKLLQEAAMPPWRRSVLPMLYCGDELVAVPGIGVDVAFQAAAEEPGIRVDWDLSYIQN